MYRNRVSFSPHQAIAGTSSAYEKTADHDPAPTLPPENDIFDLGVAVTTVNQESYQSIMKEVEKLKMDTAAVKKNIASEQNIAKVLMKDQGHAAKENTGLLRDAMQLSEQLQMTNQMQLDVQRTLLNEITVLINPETTMDLDTAGTEQANTVGTTKTLAASHSKAKMNMKAFQEHYRGAQDALAERKELMARQLALKEEQDKSNANVQRLREELARIQEEHKIRVSERERELSRLALLKSTLENEKEREEYEKANVLKAREELDQQTSALAAAKTALELQISSLKSSLLDTQKKGKDLDAMTANVSARTSDMNQQIEACNQLIAERNKYTGKLDEHRAERRHLFEEKEQIGVALAATRKDYEHLLKVAHDLETKYETDIEPMKAANAILEGNNAAKESEYKDLLILLEKFRGKIQDYEENHEKLALQAETEEINQLNESMDAQIEEAQAGLSAVQVALLKIQEEKASYETVARRLTELKEKKQNIAEKIRAKTEAAVTKRADDESLIATFREYEIIRDGAIMLKKTAKLVAAADQQT